MTGSRPVRPTHPQSERAAESFRRAGFWRAPRPAVEHWQHLSAGASRIALADRDFEWTYDMLAAAVARLGVELAAAGVAPGDPVLVVAPLRNAAAAAYFASVYHGAACVLLDRRCGRKDVVDVCAQISPAAALAFDADAERLELNRFCPVLSLDGVEVADPAGAPGFRSEPLDPDVPAIVVFTSGTTTVPKGVIHTVNSMSCGVANMARALGFTGDDAFFLSSPLASITGVLQLETAAAAHATLILEDRFAPAASLERLLRHGATVLGGAPVIAEELFAEATGQGIERLPLRVVALGGSMIAEGVLDGARRFGVEPVRVYGSSEAPFSTATSVSAEPLPTDDGAPLPGVEVALRDGELMIYGPHRFHGYLDPSHNVDSFYGDWVRTGDRAEISDGTVRITGRLKDVTVRKGMKISLTEVDAVAAGIGECAAFGLPDETTGERVALAVSTDSVSDIDYRQVADYMSAAGLAKWKIPEQVVLWDGPLPRTATGKVRRQLLTDPTHYVRISYAPRLNPPT